VKGATGFKAVLTYDAGKVKFGGFTVSSTIPGLTGLNIQDNAKGTVEIGGTTLEGAATVDRGLIGVVRFEALAGFSGRADITLKSASILRAEGRKDSEVASVISLADEGGAGPIALDLDVTAGKVTEIKNARAGQVVEVEVFGEDVQGAMGFRATMAYDPVQLKFAGFTVGPTIPGLTGLNLKDDNKGTLEVGGVSIEGISAVQKGNLGILKFEVLPGFSGVADVTLKTTTVIRPEGRKDFDAVWKVSITQFGTGPEPVGPPPGGPIQPKPGDGTGMVDLDVASGDQNSRTLNGVKAGQKVDVQIILNKDYASASAFQVVLTFDPKKLSSTVTGRKDGTSFSSALDLPAQVKDNMVTYGASILGGSTTVGKGSVAILTFETLGDFTGETEIVLSSLVIRVSGVNNTLTPGASVVLSSGGPAGLASDFDGSGDVGFDDFFQFAGAFGQPGTGENKKFDLDGDGDIGFGDFFIFAGDFGKTTKSGKAASRPGVNAQASLSVGTVSSGDRLTAQVGASNVAQMRGYSVVVSYDPSSLAFVKAERATDALLSRGGPTPLFLAREMTPGRVILADAITGGGTVSGDGALANIVFRRIGPDGAVSVDLAQVFDGSGGVDVLAAAKETPSTYALAQNYPNPFNPETQIAYSLPEAGRVRLTVYNLVGQVVRTLADGTQAAGGHSVRWDGRDEAGRRLASGVYLYRIEVNGFSAVRRMMLVK